MTALVDPASVSTIAAAPMPPAVSTDAFAFIAGRYREPTTIRAYAPVRPPWVQSAVERVVALARVEAGWGGQHTLPLQRDALQAALSVLAKVMSSQSKGPQMVLTNEGGLQLEWHAAGVDLEIEVRPDGSAEVIIEDAARGLDIDGSLGEHFDTVRALLARRLTV